MMYAGRSRCQPNRVCRSFVPAAVATLTILRSVVSYLQPEPGIDRACLMLLSFFFPFFHVALRSRILALTPFPVFPVSSRRSGEEARPVGSVSLPSSTPRSRPLNRARPRIHFAYICNKPMYIIDMQATPFGKPGATVRS